MLGAGQLFVASGAIWLMSESLQKFKDLKWSTVNNISLKDTINIVLSSFKTKSENKKSSLNNAKLSADVIKHIALKLTSWKKINWTIADNNILTYSLTNILNTFSKFNNIKSLKKFKIKNYLKLV